MSHELRTPLNAVIGFSELIEGETFGPLSKPVYVEYAQYIRESGQHLLELINDILDLSKIDSGTDELNDTTVEIDELVGSVLTLVGSRAQNQGLTIAVDIPTDLPALEADPCKLKQILVNLLSNAVKFTAPGGGVSLSCRCAADESHVFVVADSGIGMAPEDIPTALTPFRQVDSSLNRKYEGTGLGLPLAKMLVEMHGGRLEIQSARDRGTTVTVRFPPERVLARPEPAREAV